MHTSKHTNLLLTVLMAGVLLAPVVAAQDCLDYSDYLHWVHCGSPTSTVGLTIVGELAYVSETVNGLAIYDISAPTRPVRIGTVDTPGLCLGNIVVGDLAYVADGYTPGFCVVDVSDPTAPEILGTAGEGNTYLYDLAMVAPDTVWVADSYYGIRIIDVTDPAAPEIINEFAPGGSVWSIEVFDGHAFYADELGLHVSDLSLGADDEHEIGFVAIPDFNYGLAHAGDIVYVTGYDGTTVVDVHDPTAPLVVDYYATPVSTARMQIVGDLGLLVGGHNFQGSLEIIDLSDRRAPEFLIRLTTLGYGHAIACLGAFAYVTIDDRGLFVANIGNPVAPPWAGALNLSSANQIAAAGDLAYVISESSGLEIVDVGGPGIPVLVSTYVPTGFPEQIVLDGGLAYLAAGSPGLEIVDVSDPAAPSFVGLVNSSGSAACVAVKGDWAFVGSRDWGIPVIDISDPSAPVQRTRLNTPDWPNGLAAARDYLFIACRRSGLQVADISNPLAPSLVASLALPGEVWAVTLFEDLAYLCGTEDGLHIVDISTPTAPSLLATLRTPGTVVDVAADSNHVYIADLSGGLQVADVSDPATPRLVGSRDTLNLTAYGIALADDRVCLADGFGGLVVAWKQCPALSAVPDVPAADRLTVRAIPNPFNPHTTIDFGLAAPGSVDLKIYDLAGRLVRTLLTREPVAGRGGSARWYGRDDSGRSVAAGVYVCRLESGEHAATMPVVLLK